MDIVVVTIFVLAIFVGFEIITKVPPTLHTPLMSGSNAISGIAIIGAVLATVVGAISLLNRRAPSFSFHARKDDGLFRTLTPSLSATSSKCVA